MATTSMATASRRTTKEIELTPRAASSLFATRTCRRLVRRLFHFDHFARFACTFSAQSIFRFAPGKQVLDAVHAYIEYRDQQRKNAVGMKRRARHLEGVCGSFASLVFFVCCFKSNFNLPRLTRNRCGMPSAPMQRAAVLVSTQSSRSRCSREAPPRRSPPSGLKREVFLWSPRTNMTSRISWAARARNPRLLRALRRPRSSHIRCPRLPYWRLLPQRQIRHRSTTAESAQWRHK